MNELIKFKPSTRRLEKIEFALKSQNCKETHLDLKHRKQLELANLSWLNRFFHHGHWEDYKKEQKAVIAKYKGLGL